METSTLKKSLNPPTKGNCLIRTFAMVKPDAYTHIGKIIDIIYTNGFQITKLKMAKMTQQNAQEFYAEHIGKPFFTALSSFITSDVVVGMELVADCAVSKWRNLIGPTDTTKAKSEAPKSLRAMFGTDATRNAVHGSDSSASAKRELDYFFSSKLGTTAVLNNCSCVAVKPHSVLAGHAGKIIDAILEEGFEISAMEMFYLDKPSSEEFFEVYKQVLPEFVPMVEHMTTGAIIAMEVRQENVIKTLRQLVGPHDPEIAKNLRPNTLRAKYGMDRIKNAIHCTDLEEDGVLECEYFFSLLQQKKDEQAKL
jgi:nucleoside-diphosphate kinase